MKKTCFVICPIGEEQSATRKRSDIVLKYLIRPTIESLGYTVTRADQISKPGMITSQIINHIIYDDLVVADLTANNANVYYELAIRHAIKKPFVQIIEINEKLPFDIAGTRTIVVDHKDLESVEKANDEIKKQVMMCEACGTIDNPISIAVDLKNLNQSERLEERSLGEILACISSIKTELFNLNKNFSDNDKSRTNKDTNELISDFINRLNKSKELPLAPFFDISEKIDSILEIKLHRIKNTTTLKKQFELVYDDLRNLNGIIKSYIKKL